MPVSLTLAGRVSSFQPRAEGWLAAEGGLPARLRAGDEGALASSRYLVGGAFSRSAWAAVKVAGRRSALVFTFELSS